MRPCEVYIYGIVRRAWGGWQGGTGFERQCEIYQSYVLRRKHPTVRRGLQHWHIKSRFQDICKSELSVAATYPSNSHFFNHIEVTSHNFYMLIKEWTLIGSKQCTQQRKGWVNWKSPMEIIFSEALRGKWIKKERYINMIYIEYS